MASPTSGRGRDAGITLFCCGDVMTGRGVDQILPHPADPRIFEPHARTAEVYVQLAEEKNGRIRRPADWGYVWGDALAELDWIAPETRIVNLETSVTAQDTPERWKQIHYRMHPKNVRCLTAAGIQCCTLANNHARDWGAEGLLETLDTLHAVGIATAGAGPDAERAATPAVIAGGDGPRVVVFAFGLADSGIPAEWAAAARRPGVNYLPDLSTESRDRAVAQIRRAARPGDVVFVAIHWGANWGYEIAPEERAFAHALIADAGATVVCGHSAHHPKGIEVYRSRPILYGCGDFINDYEGVPGYEQYRGDLAVMYFITLDRTDGALIRLHLTPLQRRRFRLNRATTKDARWLADTLTREGGLLNTRLEPAPDGTLELRWT